MSYKHKEYMETPTASLNITTNNTYDVTEKAEVVVNVVDPTPVEISTDAGMTAVLTSANLGKCYKFTGTTGTYTNGDLYVVERDWSNLHRVGGRIFYINSSATGATYTFYDSSYNEISTQTVAGLADAYYYEVSGTGSADKFYVYDNTTHTYYFSNVVGITFINGLSNGAALAWGYDGTTTGATVDTIGSGKTNTNTVLALGVPTDYTPNIWGYIKNCRDNSLNGCNDWFIGSRAEQDQLRAVASTVDISWYSSTYMWSSVEDSSSNAYHWIHVLGIWSSGYKYNTWRCFAMRAF